ncbi:MAG: hypothetical protein KA902_06525 [Arenimonas sp.]|nr:hypothetical protein [Arenimonas sp.]
MNEITYARLLWQIPVLVLIVAGLSPEITWTSSSVGAWPIWLASFPIAYVLQKWLSHRKKLIRAQAMTYSQVLVFNHKRVKHIETQGSDRKAA